VTLDEFGKLSGSTSLDSKEVDRAKQYVIGKMTLDLEDSASMANMMVRRALLEGKVETVEEILGRVREVTAERVLTLAKRLMDPTKLNLSVVGPFRDSEKFGTLIGC
jgi:predicted Zn-dependent peptidase